MDSCTCPSAEAMEKKEAYVVLVGVKPGAYKEWEDASPYVIGVPQSQYEGFEDMAAAIEFYEDAHMKGTTRTVKKPPSTDEELEEKARRNRRRRGEKERQPRRRDDSSPSASVQAPAPTLRGSSAGKAARDAQIAAALTKGRKNWIGPSASSPSVIPGERGQSDELSRHAARTRSATEPAYHVQPEVQQSRTVPESPRTPPRHRFERRTIELPQLEPELLPRMPEMETASDCESCGLTSDILTYETQMRNRFTDSPGLLTPRYAQSLSYASSPSSSLVLSDLCTHLSSPSSCGTRYFPEDWLARQGYGQRWESNDREGHGDDGSSVLSLSKYATTPNAPEEGIIELEDGVEDTRGVPSPSPTCAHSRAGWSTGKHLSSCSSANPKAKMKARSSAMPPPATPTEAISSLNTTLTLRRTSKNPVGDVPVRPLPGGLPCACEHPAYVCINCGRRPRTERSLAPSFASTIATTASPVLFELSPLIASGMPASAIPSSVMVSTRSSSSRSHAKHTPVVGPSETRAYTRSPTARIQESLGMMSFSEAARGVGAEVVVHDVSFDPRSPIQRGTNIPVGTSGSAVRPSPPTAPVPMGSLGLLFPPS
ncbi:hypothetical protein GSI_08192 [Ganoderma sinense ZZ0214-1]|uniref:Ribonuclease H1 N-terminal domain-containing protein n=1 Tax=Ganoderma sinense ZZ0214-1 TaxID=1077348 RepID=A0A2G8S7K3_9APHY|nr:hypothetical protein GSI_08192 [Ganoderma sinense ZZ0214-1]